MQIKDHEAEGLLHEADRCRAGGDPQGEEAALNRLLELDPNSIRGHILKGDCRAKAGDEEIARNFYRSAIGLAEDRPLTEETMADVRRAGRALAGLEARAHAVREATLTGRGLPQDRWSPRLRHSLELAAGRRKLYAQQPTAFHYPELPNIQFYDPAQFSWAPAIECAAATMREELVALLEQGTDEFRAYIQNEIAAPLEANRALLGKKDWSVLSLCENGWLAPDVVKRCPRTWETILQNAPLPRVPGWGPTVLFSLLKAGAHIAPHNGMFNTRLICHLPLIVPPGCRFRVGNEECQWEEGKLLIFDDSIEHEAWNAGTEDRVVLIFDIWRPELSELEKQELTLLFAD